MDLNICEDFSAAFRITKASENDTNLPHPKFQRLAPKSRLNSREFGVERLQERRREEHKENIRKRRENVLANVRRLVNLTEDRPSSPLSPMENVEFFPKQESDIKVDNTADNNGDNVEMKELKAKKVPSKRRRSGAFQKLLSKQLMLSEWLVDIPEDFYSDWFLVRCPIGRRCIVIAAKGETKVYTKAGRLMTQFQSHLPSGSRAGSSRKSKNSTILDCIFVEQSHRFYILDVISWNGCTFYDCDTEFRFFWLKMKFDEEVKDLQEKSLASVSGSDLQAKVPLIERIQENILKGDENIANDSFLSNNDSMETDSSADLDQSNSSRSSGNFSFVSSSTGSSKISTGSSVSKLYSFEPLGYADCSVYEIQSVAQADEETQKKIDGILFYNKHSPYTPGITPLVCWLRVPMFQDMFQDIL